MTLALNIDILWYECIFPLLASTVYLNNPAGKVLLKVYFGVFWSKYTKVEVLTIDQSSGIQKTKVSLSKVSLSQKKDSPPKEIHSVSSFNYSTLLMNMQAVSVLHPPSLKITGAIIIIHHNDKFSKEHYVQTYSLSLLPDNLGTIISETNTAEGNN